MVKRVAIKVTKYQLRSGQSNTEKLMTSFKECYCVWNRYRSISCLDYDHRPLKYSESSWIVTKCCLKKSVVPMWARHVLETWNEAMNFRTDKQDPTCITDFLCWNVPHGIWKNKIVSFVHRWSQCWISSIVKRVSTKTTNQSLESRVNVSRQRSFVVELYFDVSM